MSGMVVMDSTIDILGISDVIDGSTTYGAIAKEFAILHNHTSWIDCRVLADPTPVIEGVVIANLAVLDMGFVVEQDSTTSVPVLDGETVNNGWREFLERVHVNNALRMVAVQNTRVGLEIP
jgi:hypothetical protein